MANNSIFEDIALAPPDAILNTAFAFKADTDPRKVNLGIGAYRDNDGHPYVLPSVREAEMQIATELMGDTDGKFNKEYAPIDGRGELKELTQKLMFGKDLNPRIASAQSLSGTGSIRLFADFVKKFLPKTTTMYMPKPTWGNHKAIMQAAGLEVKDYAYWDDKHKNLDFAGLCRDLNAAPEGAAVLLHAVAHNPTGIDPTNEQWDKILEIVKAKKLLPLIDCAYQGFASGDLAKDAYAMRLFENSGVEFFIAQSFAKNMGMYGERFGMIHAICNDEGRAKAVLSQIKIIIRAMYSSPPIHGANLVVKVLGTPDLYNKWVKEVSDMAGRINEMRGALRQKIEELGTPGSWNHITDQIGMFSFTGLTPDQSAKMIDTHHVYMLKTGRISMAGVNTNNVEYIAKAINDVVVNPA